jgi:hypothetical protein
MLVSERNSRDNRRRAIDQVRQREARRRRRQRVAAWGSAAVVLAGAGIGIGIGVSSAGAASYAPPSPVGPLQPPPWTGTFGPENVPIPDAPPLARTSRAIAGRTIDGIRCNSMEQALFHVHTHLTIFVAGQQRQVPAGIGIPGAKWSQTGSGPFINAGKCFYWLHTHAADGIIHIESPVERAFTLGDFFAIWGQRLGPDQVGPARGQVTVFIDGRLFGGDPRDAPLGAHEDLQVEVGFPLVAPERIDWPITGL